MTQNIYVGNLSFAATEDDLRQLFSRFGGVQSVKLITEAATGRSRGFGFVTMATEEGARKAIPALNCTAHMNRTLSVSEARPQGSQDEWTGHHSKGQNRTNGHNRRRG